MNQLVSIIVPVYNIQEYLKKCIESLIHQSYENIEIILVDDGSTDDSLNICLQYKEIDKRVSVIDKQNGGLSSARNAGLRVAKGDNYVFVDGDDYVHPQYIECLLNGLNESGADIAVCGINIVNEKEESVSRLATGVEYKKNNPLRDEVLTSDIIEKKYYTNSKYGFWYVVAWNKMYKSYVFEGLEYDEGVIYEDEFLFNRLIRKSKLIKCIPEELYFYVQRDGGITSEKKDRERFHYLTEIYDRRMLCYFEKNNTELQTLCSEKYLKQIISKYYLLDNDEKKEVKAKYYYIINSIEVNKKFRLFYPFIWVISCLNRLVRGK